MYKRETQTWLTVLSDHNHIQWPPSLDGLKVIIESSKVIHKFGDKESYRTSPIFPLCHNNIFPDLQSRINYLYFYCFDPAYPILGKMVNRSSEELKTRLWYSIGLASVILITEKNRLNDELLNLSGPPKWMEIWTVKASKITDIKCNSYTQAIYEPEKLAIHEYNNLPLVPRSTIDEFVSSMALIAPKVAQFLPSELENFIKLVGKINKVIAELVYLYHPKGSPPATLKEYTEKQLQLDESLREAIIHQDISRIVQVNSALSYVSSQILSGAIPIIERRSLIRRNSLLGIGTAILALTRMTRIIERAFAECPIESIIVNDMAKAGPLSGLEKLPSYNPTDWKLKNSVLVFEKNVKSRDWDPKLPYYSGRLGFRETEYTISAAIQSIAAGATPEWSLHTFTHEIMHGHVRKILSAIFQGNPDTLAQYNWDVFYQRYHAKLGHKLSDENELDSLRSIIFMYCHQTATTGSLTKKSTPSGQTTNIQNNLTIDIPPQKILFGILECENRNISEIFTHILDLHYFYGSRISAYIPLIWRSWAVLPHVKADLRQYILRSLLTISVKTTGEVRERFDYSIELLDEFLEKYIKDVSDKPLIKEVREKIKDDTWKETLYDPFSSSIILVDMVDSIFVSGRIRTRLIGDDVINWLTRESEFEHRFEYLLPNEFTEEKIKTPTACLLGKILLQLENTDISNNVEAETAKIFLACSSNLDTEGLS